MPLKNLLLVIFISVLLTSIFYANLDKFTSLFQKITGYTSIVIYGTVVSPQANASDTPQSTALTATVTQPQEQTNIVPEASISATVEKKEEKKQYVNQTLLLQVINQTETLKVKLDKLRTSSRSILEYYSSINDTKSAEKWVNVIVLFNQALDDLGKVQTYTENVKDSATKENASTIKDMVGDVLRTLEKIVKLIKSQ